MNINGNGLANATGKQLLQIIPINIVVILTIVASAVGLYYKFDSRIAALEKNPSAMTQEERANLINRVIRTEQKIDKLEPDITETHTNVLWLMDKQSAGLPKKP